LFSSIFQNEHMLFLKWKYNKTCLCKNNTLQWTTHGLEMKPKTFNTAFVLLPSGLSFSLRILFPLIYLFLICNLLSKKKLLIFCFSSTNKFYLYVLPYSISSSLNTILLRHLASCSSRFTLNCNISHASLINPSKHVHCAFCFLIFKFHSCLHLYSSQCLVPCFAPSTHFLNVYWFEKTTIK
jgi:hypothetical protein